MQIIDTCLWSEPHEQKCLEVKLNCEAELVTEWIFIQSDYTFRGEYKGCSLEKVLSQPQFSPFKDRIHIISIKENLFERLCKSHCEEEYFKVEFASRQACWEYISSKYNDETRILVSDVDELIDFSDSNRRDEFIKICKNKSSWQAKQLKYWWGYANISFYPKYIPIHTIKTLKDGKTSFTHRNNGCDMVEGNILLAMEYSYSFSPSENFRKCSTFAHDRYNQECINEALYFNTWHKTDQRQEKLGSSIYDWFETIELNEYNSPRFVLENFDRLDPKTINPNYAEERKNILGLQYPHPCEQHNLLRGNKIDRRYHYLRRNK